MNHPLFKGANPLGSVKVIRDKDLRDDEYKFEKGVLHAGLWTWKWIKKRFIKVKGDPS